MGERGDFEEETKQETVELLLSKGRSLRERSGCNLRPPLFSSALSLRCFSPSNVPRKESRCAANDRLRQPATVMGRKRPPDSRAGFPGGIPVE